MQIILTLVVAYGLVARQPKAVTNGAVALLVIVLPTALEHRYAFPLDRWLDL